ncbi:tRNA (adenosine(37)-N6)-threonylcarbamoyltransferase complex dimerization subunit type 1 TsaB [Motiliproteus sp. SC1-56]|uniref:tRNA (adenosine(37)-N6)-threonylcarbamoyltransferase complex dimerization subunit type 1 TsaB n=1 Tax=Motiliproteus sp. SC1-56 TaxID=2799565 RepID=UPI001A90328D|nr:tRNA (adenosine(37)-N6)-threonylcarbamoyltransferase complex dimerization subunit type 1 TsaB [Motiliproteus sp. SC1-56]
MAKILALDTSTDACSVALLVDGEVSEDFRVIPRQHTQALLPMVDARLSEAGLTLSQLDAIAFGRGPGSFTGLRITAGVAQGLAMGAGLPLLPVSTLAALAEDARHATGADTVLAALDARMNEVYWGQYRWSGDRMRLEGEELVCPPDTVDVPAHPGTAVGWGPGWRYPELQARFEGRLQHMEVECQPRAGWMARIGARALADGEALAAEAAQPVYLRDQVTWKKLKDQ